MKLVSMLDLETEGIETLLQSYTTVPLEKIERVQKEIITELEPVIRDHVKNMWVPQVAEDILKPHAMDVLPLLLRQHLVDMLDEEYPEKEILLKFHQYIILCNTFTDGIMMMYKKRYDQVIRKLGGQAIINNYKSN